MVGLCLLVTVQAAAQDCDDGAPCPYVPVPSECNETTIKAAFAQSIILKKLIVEKTSNYAGDDSKAFEAAEAEIKLYTEILNFAYKCEKAGQRLKCQTFDQPFVFGMKRAISHGWYKDYSAFFVNDKDGGCMLDKEGSLASYIIKSINGIGIFSVMPSKASVHSGLSFSLSSPVICSSELGAETRRSMTFSDRMVAVVDQMPIELNISEKKQPVKSISFKEPKAMKIIPLDKDVIRLQWGDGGHVDMSPDAKIKGSDFLDEIVWKDCKTIKKNGQYIPLLKVKDGQTFAKEPVGP